MFLVNFEFSIVSTSLVAITNDLRHLSQSSWVITAYLLTYTSFMIFLAKLSDVFGRKVLLLFSVAMFTVFSGGCAASQTMLQLYSLPSTILWNLTHSGIELSAELFKVSAAAGFSPSS